MTYTTPYTTLHHTCVCHPPYTPLMWCRGAPHPFAGASGVDAPHHKNPFREPQGGTKPKYAEVRIRPLGISSGLNDDVDHAEQARF
jgi:hypothetical protein